MMRRNRESVAGASPVSTPCEKASPTIRTRRGFEAVGTRRGAIADSGFVVGGPWWGVSVAPGFVSACVVHLGRRADYGDGDPPITVMTLPSPPNVWSRVPPA